MSERIEKYQAFYDAYEALCREHGLTFWAYSDRDYAEIEINDLDESDLKRFRAAVQ